MSQTTGLSSLLEGYGSSSSDDDDDDDEVNPKVEAVNMPAVPPTAAVAPSADAETTAPSSSSEPPGGGGQVLHYRTRPCRFFARNGNCRNGDTCNFSHDRSQQKQQQQQQGPSSIRDHDAPPLAKKQRTTGELVASTSSGNAKASLLQKLLANDMKREAILTLQILDYIVGSSFLQEQE